MRDGIFRRTARISATAKCPPFANVCRHCPSKNSERGASRGPFRTGKLAKDGVTLAMSKSAIGRLSPLLALVVAVSTSCQALALEPVAWQTDFETARQMAQQSNRLVLLHFWSPECGPCRALESKVFNQPGFAQAVSVHYVPVKVNVLEQPGLAHAYKVTQYPTEVVTGLDGKEITRFRPPMNPASYLATVTQVARAHPAIVKPFGDGPATAPSVAAQQPGGYPPPTVPPSAPPMIQHPPGATANSASGPPAVVAAAAVNPPPPQAAGEPAPLGLDGYCPVRLCENRAWVKGNTLYGATHRGRLYLFAGPDEQQRFLQNPDRYSPVAGGEDPVMAVDQGLRVGGKREFGLYLGHRVYLFSSEETLQRFRQDPNRYSTVVLQAERPTERY